MRQTRAPRSNFSKALDRESRARVQAENGERWDWISARRREIVAETGMPSVEAWDLAAAEWDREHGA